MKMQGIMDVKYDILVPVKKNYHLEITNVVPYINPNPHMGGVGVKGPPSKFCIWPKKLCNKILLKLPDFSYCGLLYVMKKVSGNSDAFFIFHRGSKFLCQYFYIVISENSWHFRNSSILTSNFQMLIKILSLNLVGWFFLWNLSKCPNFFKKIAYQALNPPLCLIYIKFL